MQLCAERTSVDLGVLERTSLGRELGEPLALESPDGATGEVLSFTTASSVGATPSTSRLYR